MFSPTLPEFLKRSQEKKYVLVGFEMLSDTFTPVSLYQKLRQLSPYSYLLESVLQSSLGRFSFIGFDPAMVFSSQGENLTLRHGDNLSEEENFTGKPAEIFPELMQKYAPWEDETQKNMNSGAVGYFGYDMIRHFEQIPDQNPDDLGIPESFFIIPKGICIFDHFRQMLSVSVLTEGGNEKKYQESCDRLKEWVKILGQNNEKTFTLSALDHENGVLTEEDYSSNTPREVFLQNVKKAKQYIHEGDIFQVVLAQRFEMDYEGDPFEIYRSLRSINPSPYLFFLEYPDFSIAGSSPEILVKKTGEDLNLRPIAGTIRRGKNAEEDAKLEKQLLQDPKEIAEHMMLLDLGRNDLGRISEFASITISDLLSIENYSHVKHIVTNIKSKAKKELSFHDVFRAVFPAGTLSGAPKIRAMEIIDELEVSRRSLYGGSIGNISFNGDIDACIAIRTVLLKANKAYIQAGAGIVADSEPEKEYLESYNKAAALMSAVKQTKGKQ